MMTMAVLMYSSGRAASFIVLARPREEVADDQAENQGEDEAELAASCSATRGS